MSQSDVLIAELKVDVDRLHRLLANPEPGLITWWKMLHECMDKLTEVWGGR